MGKAWIVVANREKMKIYEHRSDRDPLQLVASLENELSHLSDSALSRHKPGMIQEGGHKGASRHVMNAGRRPHDLQTDYIAHRIVTFLNHKRIQNHLEDLRIFAEPRMLGRIKAMMPQATRKIVSSWMNKDLIKLPLFSLSKEIKQIESVRR